MRRRLILAGFLSLLLIASLATGMLGSGAWFSDTETSNGNTFTAGTLDLTLDGQNGTNIVKFTLCNLRPGSQPAGKFTLANLGSIGGFVDLENINWTSQENGVIEPESQAGDTTVDVGELQDVLNLRLFHDVDGDGWIGSGDTVFYNGKVKDVPGSFDQNISLPAGGTTYVTAIFDWWSTADDNKAQSDSFTLNMTFELGQQTGQ